MGAKQSKRSVDISGKEAESAGEVAASIAGGEGRVEQLADADALKPQLNGDAHIHETEEKQKDSSTPENEKDATTEKEAKQQEEEKELVAVSNGESEQKVENGESTPTPEDGKKPKKEKVKKKWSLRSISFSRKDKPKQEKKQKDEELKTNGEPEKVPEETAEAAPEVPAVTEAAEVKNASEVKEDKTPETPVTEPITNGSSTPESPKVETPVVEEAVVPSAESVKAEPRVETEPEEVPINGLSLEETVKESTENKKNEDSKEVPTTDTTEIVPEISVKKEVCVEKMPLIDSTPPPLPANPPPSSVATFAATMMAPELTDASLANTADNATQPPPNSDPIVKDELDIIPPSEPVNDLTDTQAIKTELSPPAKDISDDSATIIPDNEIEDGIKETICNLDTNENCAPVIVENVFILPDTVEKSVIEEETTQIAEVVLPAAPSELAEKTEIASSETEQAMPSPPPEVVATTEVYLKETLCSDNTEMPSPPSELVEPDIQKDNEPTEGEEPVLLPPSELKNEELPDVSALPVAVLAEPVTEEMNDVENLMVSAESEMPAPPEDILSETEVNNDVLNNVEDLPPPPLPLSEETGVEEKADLSKSNSNKILSNSYPVSDTEDIGSAKIDLKDDNENLDQNLKNKSKDSLGNLIETIECNGNIESINSVSQKNTEIISPNNVEEIVNGESGRMATIPGDPPTSEKDVHAVAESFPMPPSDPCQPLTGASPALATPQEPSPVSDKLADLIPEVPEVPELKTETLQETTSDVAVAN